MHKKSFIILSLLVYKNNLLKIFHKIAINMIIKISELEVLIKTRQIEIFTRHIDLTRKLKISNLF